MIVCMNRLSCVFVSMVYVMIIIVSVNVRIVSWLYGRIRFCIIVMLLFIYDGFMICMFCVLNSMCVVWIRIRFMLKVVSSVLSGWLYRCCSMSCLSMMLMSVVIVNDIGMVMSGY